MKRWIGLTTWLTWAAMSLIVGCASGNSKSTGKGASASLIDQINLLALPVAVNMDALPGPDGFLVKVYAGSRRKPKPLPILEGTLEVLMFDGIPKQNDPTQSPPRCAWKYSAEELKGYVTKSYIGTGYQLSPRWGDAKPAGDKITILVRYSPPEGAAIYSAPSIISVTSQ